MNKKTHKYLLAENPVNNKEVEHFIFSTRDNKKALIEVKELQLLDLFSSRGKEKFHIVFFSSKKTGFPKFFELSLFDNIDIEDEKINIVLKDAGKWYKNVLIYQEKQDLVVKVIKPLIKDYSDKIKGLKIIYSDLKQEYLVIFRGKIKVFSTEEKMFLWLSGDMRVEKKLLGKGFINKLKNITDI